uniref:ubiquitinyl hydrolase 1 n=1 Tax=Hirondellea gigas TaxID=1518452 RepID=A0A2P2I777_9CRUS
MSGGDSDSKWACGRCTYLNYNNSSRCTMCYNSKPHHLIIPTTTAVSATAAGSGGFVTTTNDEVITTPPPDAPYPITGDKWACIECTYLNYPRSIRCCQCYSQRATDAATSPDQTPDSQALSPCSPPHTNRSSHSPHSHNTTVIAGHSPPPRSPHHHPTTPPKATTNTNTQSSTHNKSRQSPTLKSRQSPPLKSRQSPPLKSRQSPPLKFHHQSSPKGRRSPPRQFSHKQIQQSARVPPQQQQVSPNKVAAKNRVNHETQTSPTALVEHMLPHKWSCSSCTYENWPRSSRCIMCATPKSMSDKNQGACKGNSPPYTNTNICSTTASKNNCRASSPMNTVSFDQLSKRNLSSPCSKSIGINELATSDVNNSTVSTNVSERRTAPADLQSRFIVSDREESKTCESINLINRNRSLNKDSLPPNSISSNNVDSINVSSSFPRTATVTSISSSSPIITSCSADANATALSVSQTSSPTGNSTTTTNSIGGTTTPSSISVVSVTITSSSNSTSGVPTTTTYSMSGNNGSENTSVRGRGAEGAMALNNYETERLLRKLRRRLMDADLAFLNACIGVVEGNYEPVERYLSSGGDPMRNLTSADIKLLARPSAFDEGHTLVHLAIRFGREDLLDTILSGINGGGCGVKRVPCYVAPDLAADIRRTIAASLRQRRDTFPCYCVSEFVTYSLPPEVEMLGSSNAQDRLWDELLDRDAQKQLEEDSPIINWSLELTDRLASRLYALWNRTAGDCLLDSVLQATWGVFDRDNCLRRALASSISDGAHTLFPRWKEYERLQARMLNYAVPENQV